MELFFLNTLRAGVRYICTLKSA